MTSSHFSISDDRGERIEEVLPESMRPFLLQRADGSGGSVELAAVDVTTAEGRRDARARVTPDGSGGWDVHLRHSDPDGEHDLVGRAPNTDAVFDLLRSWAADDGWWQEAFSWRPIDVGA